MKNFFRREWLLLLALAVPFVVIAFVWNRLPETIATHYNFEGQPDDYGSKAFGTLLLPGMNIIIYLVLLFIPRIDPRYNNYAEFQKTYLAIRLVIHIFLSLLSIAIVYTAMTGNTFSLRFIPVFAFLLIAVIGYYLPKVKSNFFVGIRTPWTLSNETVWKKTHEFGGKVMLYTGILICILIFVLPGEYLLWVILPGVAVISIVPIVYSYLEYRKIRNDSTANNN